jgi:multidrug efflux pump subunit AcrA (membrane-fusion protein)
MADKGGSQIFQFDEKFRSIELVQSLHRERKVGQIIFWGLLVWILILMFVPWQQTSTGSGRVIAYSPTERRQSIDAPVEGRLGRWFVHEGSHVEAGDPIVEMADNDPEILNRLKAEQIAVQARLSASQIAEQTAKINLERQKILADEGLSSRRSYELARLEHAKYLTDEANSKAELVKLETRLVRQSRQFVQAPRSGTILRRVAGESSVLVKAGEELATLVPDTDSRSVEIWIGGNDISLISEGQKVRLQFEGWPAIQFSGWPSVAVGTFAGRVAVIDAADGGDGKFRVLVTPDADADPWPSTRYLRQGIRAQGWILMGRVKLGFELWRRFNGFPPSLPGPLGKPSVTKK